MSPRLALVTAAIALAGLTAGGPAAAQGGAVMHGSLSEGLFGRRPEDGRSTLRAPPVARFVSDEGAAFVLERRGPRALLRFEGSDEVWVLRPEAGPRGDLIFRNDVGRPVLTASRLGGLTVYTPLRPGGAPAAYASGAQALTLAPMSPELLLRRFVGASVQASRAVGHLIMFEGPDDVRPQEASLFADAASVTSSAIARAASAARPSRVMARLRQVRITRGRTPSATVNAGAVDVVIAPSEGVAGRPSSDRIVQALASAR